MKPDSCFTTEFIPRLWEEPLFIFFYTEVSVMGTVAVTLKVMPSSPDVNLEKIKKEVKNSLGSEAKLEQINEKPVAFGLKCLEVLITMPDTGGTDKIEEKLSSIEGVESVSTENVTLI